MPQDYDKAAYPEPPSRTPAVEKQTGLPNPALILSKLFYYSVDVPVTAFREAIEGVQGSKKTPYYHQRFRRVPELVECEEGDYLCYYEAEMQWRRDFKVDQEIVKVVQERLQACQQREGPSYTQNCFTELQLFKQVSQAYQSRYGDLGAHGSSRKCLMKQKERMMMAAAAAEAQKA